MKRFKIEQSVADIISHNGLALIGQAIKRHTNLTPEINTQVPLRHGTKHSDVIKSYLAIVCVCHAFTGTEGRYPPDPGVTRS